MPYIIPRTTIEVHTVLPNTHISPETTYIVEYPFGFVLLVAYANRAYEEKKTKILDTKAAAKAAIAGAKAMED